MSLLMSNPNNVQEDFLDYKIHLLRKVMFIAIFFSLLTVITYALNLLPYPLDPIQVTANYIFITTTIGFCIFLRLRKQYYHLIVHAFLITAFALSSMAFIFMPDDNFRAIWFYIIVFLAFILINKYMGFLYTFIAIVFMLVIEIYFETNLSELTLNSSILGLAIFSLLFASYTKQLLNYEKTLEEKNHELQLLTTLDGLTGIYNRRAFTHMSKTLFLEQKEKAQSLVCLLIDIDHFKKVNDTYGHDAGDKTLKEFTQLVNTLISHETVFSRVGGEEFGLLIQNETIDTIKVLAKNIIEKVDKLQIAHETQHIHITISIGISAMLKSDLAFQELYARSDKALYKAKQLGRNQCIVFAT